MVDTVKERPILFSSPMVRAILAGTKTQTRRIIKPQPRPGRLGNGDIIHSTPGMIGESYYVLDLGKRGTIPLTQGCMYRVRGACPYGVPGDRLWVRESWNVSGLAWGNKPSEAAKIAAPSAWRYAATDEGSWQHGWRPSIHMPRTASRITLEVTGVRVERLQSITEDDAEAEGVEPAPFCKAGRPPGQEHVETFEELWDKINGARASWSSNPFVWVVEFRRVQP